MKTNSHGWARPAAWALAAGICALAVSFLVSPAETPEAPTYSESDNTYSLVLPMVPRH